MDNVSVIEAKRAYHKEWRAKNKDKIAASNKRYWERRAAKIAAERERAKERAE